MYEEDHCHRPQHEDGPHDGGLLRADQPGVEVGGRGEGAGRGAATVAGGRRGLVRVKLYVVGGKSSCIFFPAAKPSVPGTVGVVVLVDGGLVFQSRLCCYTSHSIFFGVG